MMLHKKQISKGCFNTNTKKFNYGNIEFKGCLGNLYDPYTDYIWELFTQYGNNLLPYKGNLGNQPSKIMQIFSIIQGLISEHEKKLKGQKALSDAMKKRLAGNG